MKTSVLLCVFVPLLASAFQSNYLYQSATPRPLFGGFFDSLFSKFHPKPRIPKPETTPTKIPDLCTKYQNTIFLEGKCLLLVDEPKTYTKAKHDCEHREDGKLYRHNIENPFLYEYIYKFFPRYFDALKEEVWTVFMSELGSASPKIVDTSNEDADVTKNPYLYKAAQNFVTPEHKFNFPEARCIYFNHRLGFLIPGTASCDGVKKTYICEFPSSDPKYVQQLW